MKFTSTNESLAKRVANGKETEMKNGVCFTRREKEVLELVSKGMTAQEIAIRLFVSLDTVETHRRNIIRKMNARNIVHAVVRAMRAGVME